MFSPPLARRSLPALCLLALLLAPACQTPSTDTPPASSAPVQPAPPLAQLGYDGSQAALESLDRDLARAKQHPAQLAALAQRLFAVLRDPAATPAARQAVCQRLRSFPPALLTAGDRPTLFGAMLADESQLNFAQLALQDAPGSAVDAIYLRALTAATPRTRLAFVQTLGRRRMATAVAPLTPLLNDPDWAVAAATATALGEIGTPAALAALQAAPEPHSARVVTARLSAAHHLGGAAAIREFHHLLDTPQVPAKLRAAALRGLLFAEPLAAPARIVTALTANDPAQTPVVLEALASLPSPDLVPALTANLPAWPVATQLAVISALGQRGDERAVPALATATQHADADVRSAAIAALGFLPGSADTAKLLAQLATGPNLEEAKLARQSLARLAGPAASAAVLDGAVSAPTPVRIVFLDAIATRNMTDAVPLLLQTRADPAAAVRSAALGSLADLGAASDQAAILDWALAATDSAEQGRALRALASVTLRNPDVAQRARPIIDVIDRSAPEVSLRLLPVLPRIGGPAAAACAARAALRDTPALAGAATTMLGRWTDDAGLIPLVEVAEKAPIQTVRTAAVQAAIRYLERSRTWSAADLGAIVTRLVAAAQDSAAQAQLIYFLSRADTAESVALAEKFLADPLLATAANDAVLGIRSRLAGPPVLRASTRSEQLKNISDGNPATGWGVPATAQQWIEFDFHSPRPFRQVVLECGNKYNYPEQVELFVTDDLNVPGPALSTAGGQPGKLTLDFPAVARGRYLLVRHTKERADSWWTVAELLVD